MCSSTLDFDQEGGSKRVTKRAPWAYLHTHAGVRHNQLQHTCIPPNHQNTPTVPGRVPTTPAGPNYTAHTTNIPHTQRRGRTHHTHMYTHSRRLAHYLHTHTKSRVGNPFFTFGGRRAPADTYLHTHNQLFAPPAKAYLPIPTSHNTGRIRLYLPPS